MAIGCLDRTMTAEIGCLDRTMTVAIGCFVWTERRHWRLVALTEG